MLVLWGFVIILAVGLIRRSMRRTSAHRRLKNEGFEWFGAVDYHQHLWVRDHDDNVYIGGDINNLAPIEVIRLSEITQNARLVALEIRCRVNGEVRSLRVIGRDENDLLKCMDKLGYS